MPAKIEFSKRVENEMKRTASIDEIALIMRGFIKSTGWDVMGTAVKPILDGRADSISIRKDRPRIRLYVRRGFFKPQISFDIEMGAEKEMKMVVPIKDIEKMFEVEGRPNP